MADAITWIALGIAGYAAGVSTYHEIAQRREGRSRLERQIRVEARGRATSTPPYMIRMVRAINTKRRPVEIARVGVRLDNGMLIWQPPGDNLPARLGDGESVQIEVSDSWLGLIENTSPGAKIAAYAVEDSTGAIYESEPSPPPQAD